jgi:hypothetical protein
MIKTVILAAGLAAFALSATASSHMLRSANASVSVGKADALQDRTIVGYKRHIERQYAGLD